MRVRVEKFISGMTRKLILTGLALSMVAGAMADPITPEEALMRAGKSGMPGTRGIEASAAPQLSLTKMTDAGSPAVYVFNNEEDGFLILSADDVAYPLLGYSDSGRITPEEVELNPALEWWLSEYARQIEYASAHKIPAGSNSIKIPSTRAGREPIAPMIKTTWDQGEPYYNQCPLKGVDRTYTGCVATAMAQVMNYWKYPEVGRGQIGYDCEGLGKRLSMNFSRQKFDWDNMLPSYSGKYTEAQADAVAYLMKACGYAVKMEYGTDSSGALAMNISNGLKKFFNYDPNMLYTLRQYYHSSQWDEMIYDNLKNVGPILYGGASMLGGGHSFICDGYDGNGLFHFNWGWTSMSDGYFSLDALNPESLGAGGGSGGGYNFTQDALFGIQPPTGLPEEYRPEFLTQMGSLGAWIDEKEKGILHFQLWGEEMAMWVNYNPSVVRVGFGAIIEPQGNTPGEVVKMPVSDARYEMRPGYGTSTEYFDPSIDLLKLGLSDGVYKLTFATYDLDEENPEYVPVKTSYNYFNYVTLKKTGEKFEVVVDEIWSLGVEDAEIVGDFYYGCPVTVRAKIRNNSDIELTSGVAPCFAINTEEGPAMAFLGESILVTLPPHSSVEREWTTSIYNLAGVKVTEDMNVIFSFFDEMTYVIYQNDFAKTVTMKANPGPPTLDYGTAAPTIAQTPVMNEISPNGNKIAVYQVPEAEKNNIKVRANIKLKSGYCNYPIYALVLTPAPSEEESGRMAIEYYNGEVMQLEQGVRKRFSTTLNFQAGKPDILYSIALGYLYDNGIVPISGPWAYMRLIPDLTAVDQITGDSTAIEIDYDKASQCVTAASAAGIATIEAYDMQGKKIAASAGSETLSLTGFSGLAVVKVLNNDGETKSLKVML